MPKPWTEKRSKFWWRVVYSLYGFSVLCFVAGYVFAFRGGL